jgi:hypothetical protein
MALIMELLEGGSLAARIHSRWWGWKGLEGGVVGLGVGVVR